MAGMHRAYFDDQCEVCQAGVAWLRILDRADRVACLPIEEETLRASDPPLDRDQCLRELHVVTPDGQVRRGWDAVARLARLFPTTWLIGAVGALPPFSWLLPRLAPLPRATRALVALLPVQRRAPSAARLSAVRSVPLSAA